MNDTRCVDSGDYNESGAANYDPPEISAFQHLPHLFFSSLLR